LSPGRRPGRRRTARLALALVAAVSCAAPGEAPGAGGADATPTGPLDSRDFGGTRADVHGELVVDTSHATVRMQDRYFEPNVLTGPGDVPLSLTLRNEGRLLHNFSLPLQGISHDVPPSSIVAISVRVPSSGEVVFHCRFHREEGMLGALGTR
jgi:plastocyanin